MFTLIIRAFFCVLLFFCAFQSVQAQPTAQFQRLFNPSNPLSIELRLTQTEWDQIAGEQPVGGACAFGQDPSIDRYTWHQITAAISLTGASPASRTYTNIGIKKRSFCGSLDNVKPSLSLNLDKFNNANEALALAQLGTKHLVLGNAKQDRDLFRQCAGYHVLRALGHPSSFCTLASLSRKDGNAAPVFLGVYVLVEAVKKDFFDRRPGLQNVRDGSLYELEAYDDFNAASIPQLQVEWSGSNAQDFSFGVNTLAANNATALDQVLDIPSFINLWASEIYLKHWDGYTRNRNNTYMFDDPQANPNAITRTRFRFVPHGIDQVANNPGTAPEIFNSAIPAQISWQHPVLRYRLLSRLAEMGTIITSANVSSLVSGLEPLAQTQWTGNDALLGSNTQISTKANTVRNDFAQALVDLRATFGVGIMSPTTIASVNIADVQHFHCMKPAPSAAGNKEVGHDNCATATTPPGQILIKPWRFEAAPPVAGTPSFAYVDAPKLFRVKHGANCLTPDTPDSGGRMHLITTSCDASNDNQRFFLVKRASDQFELRAFAQENACAHFSDAIRTPDNRQAVYLAACDGSAKNRLFIGAPPPNSIRCPQIQREIDGINAEIHALQADLHSASPGQKAAIVAQIKKLIRDRTVLVNEKNTRHCHP